MEKKILFLSMMIMVILISGCNENKIYHKNETGEMKINEPTNEIEIKGGNQTINEKIYDWNIEVILCKECSPYKAESISQDELDRIKDEFISNFEKGELIFDKFRSNGFFVNATNKAKDMLDEAEITGATLKTFYFKLIINEEMQKEPLDNEEL